MEDFQNIRHYFKQLCWDTNLSEEELEELLWGKQTMIRGITSQNIYVKLLSSYNWYTLLKITGKEKLREILTDNVIKKLKSKTLQQKYYYARAVLF